jgi:tetratricopeptide (TPR) repeat protein
MVHSLMLCRISFAALGLAAFMQTGFAVPVDCHPPPALEHEVHSHPTVRSWAALGGWYGEKQQFGCAIPAFQAAIRLDPDSARMHYFLGLTLSSAGKQDAAAEELEKSISLDSKEIRPRLALGVALNQLNREAEAEAAWESVLNIDPNSVAAIDWLAKGRISRGEFASAIDLLHGVPRDENLTLDLSVAYARAGLFDDASETLKAAFARSPGSVRLASALASVYVQSHRNQEAESVLREFLNKHPSDTLTQILYLRLLVLQGNSSTARPLAKRLLAEEPGNFDALYLSGIIEREAQEYPAAIADLKAAAALDPNHYDVRYHLGIALFRSQQTEAAREQLEKAVQLDPSEAEAHFQLAQVLRALGQTDEAQIQLKVYQQRMQELTKRTLAISKAGQAAQSMKAGDADAAAALYREAIEAQPDDAILQYNLGLALERTGDAAAERTALEAAVRLKPGFAEAENQLGYVSARAGDLSAAETHFRNALVAAPSYAEAANNLGTMLSQHGRENEGEVYLRSAVTANPRYVPAWVNLAATLASESRFEEARTAVANALRIDARDSDALRLRQMLSTVPGADGSASGLGRGPITAPSQPNAPMPH